MTEVISVKFKDGGRAYYFAPCGIKVKVGDSVIVETQNGTEFGFSFSFNRASFTSTGDFSLNDDNSIIPIESVSMP